MKLHVTKQVFAHRGGVSRPDRPIPSAGGELASYQLPQHCAYTHRDQQHDHHGCTMSPIPYDALQHGHTSPTSFWIVRGRVHRQMHGHDIYDTNWRSITSAHMIHTCRHKAAASRVADSPKENMSTFDVHRSPVRTSGAMYAKVLQHKPHRHQSRVQNCSTHFQARTSQIEDHQ